MTDPLAEEDSATALSLPPAAVAVAVAVAAAAVGVAVAELGVDPPHPENDSANAIAVATRRIIAAFSIRIMCKSRLLICAQTEESADRRAFDIASSSSAKRLHLWTYPKADRVCERRQREKTDETRIVGGIAARANRTNRIWDRICRVNRGVNACPYICSAVFPAGGHHAGRDLRRNHGTGSRTRRSKCRYSPSCEYPGRSIRLPTARPQSRGHPQSASRL